jgi:hypothetical protein
MQASCPRGVGIDQIKGLKTVGCRAAAKKPQCFLLNDSHHGLRSTFLRQGSSHRFEIGTSNSCHSRINLHHHHAGCASLQGLTGHNGTATTEFQPTAISELWSKHVHHR